MPSWKKQKDREDAVWKLLKRLDTDRELRTQCRTNSATAKEELTKAGNFSNMPAKVEVRVLANKKSDMDNLVIIVLPKFGKLKDLKDIHDAWVCCWHLWLRSFAGQAGDIRQQKLAKTKQREKPGR